MSAKSPNMAPRDDDADWLAALRAYAQTHGIEAAAIKIGRARPSVSLLLSGNYPAGTDKIAARIRADLMDQVRCPGFGADIPVEECRDQAARPFSGASSRSAALYRACRACPNRPKEVANA